MAEKANNEKPLKRCKNAACAMRDMKVRTDLTKCIACQRDMSPASGLGDLFDSFFGPGGPKS